MKFADYISKLAFDTSNYDFLDFVFCGKKLR